MKSSTSIRGMLAGNKIFVPNYQRAYSWDTNLIDKTSVEHVNTFLSDLDEYNKSSTVSKYYFGHFLFEEIDSETFAIIDGQQRLTTIIIFLSVLFNRIKQIRPLNKLEQEIFQDIIKHNSTYRFETVQYDKQVFKDYVIDQLNKDRDNLDTYSSKRIVDAFDFFTLQLANEQEHYLLKMLDTIYNASCTTHPVLDESEAIQMFIFQNNRGKSPSNLEIIKAQFMFNIHLHGGEEKNLLIDEIKNRFETIYTSISSIEYKIKEDDILIYTLRVFFNSLGEGDAIGKINQILSQKDSVQFIRKFTYSLYKGFEYLKKFFGVDENKNIEIHSLVTLGGIGIAVPFIIKAYSFNLSIESICILCKGLESIVLRHRLIGTRADIIPRLNDVFQKFTKDEPDISLIINRIEWMKIVSHDSWWWSYWNNKELENAIKGKLNYSVARYLLWKYENSLEKSGKGGYQVTRFDKIISPQLEHIAPQTENPQKGYDDYDEEFKKYYIDCLGNYLLLSQPHNGSIGNKPFSVKRSSYNHSEQQREIQRMTSENPVWTKELIQIRKEKITKFILENI